MKRLAGTFLIVGSILWLYGAFSPISLIGTLEFVGPNEERGWALAGTIVPIAYIAWSIWLIAMGVAFIL